MENGQLTISGAAGPRTFPTRFQLISAMNPWTWALKQPLLFVFLSVRRPQIQSLGVANPKDFSLLNRFG